ncbi:MAG: cytochrome c biogenesis protein CcmE [Chromatiales bacterium 21-64-14]|nr:MAG: cytochrome c biogenesis protein CcmE [Chromatiales bacterium 21-64-14]HQU14613.1 cytochrome c maturation protein CcmE [Gammaproteobacteria bacterium]
MTPKRRRRLIFVVVLVTGIGTSVGLASYAFRQNLLYFYSPTQVAKGEAPVHHMFRVGGLVEKGSVHHDGLTVHFVVTDTAKTVPVVYTGLLPDLFRVGQGVVAQGRLNRNGVFMATEVLAKHDSTYMPPEVARALKKAHLRALEKAKEAEVAQK